MKPKKMRNRPSKTATASSGSACPWAKSGELLKFRRAVEYARLAAHEQRCRATPPDRRKGFEYRVPAQVILPAQDTSPTARGFQEALAGAQHVPRRLLIPRYLFRAKTLRDSYCSRSPRLEAGAADRLGLERPPRAVIIKSTGHPSSVGRAADS